METARDCRDAVPLTILTGFLGAGKTTLLNRILRGDHGLRVAVLVNDFGAINVDAELVVGVESDTISLTNGCICCQIRDDLVETIQQLLARPESVEYILLEASGVADPGSIFVTFSDPDLRDRIRLDSVTCLVDAEQVFAYEEYPAIVQLKLHQIGFSDMVVLNKADLAGPDQMARVRAWIDQHFNRVRTVEASYCNVPYEILLAAGRFDPDRVVSDKASAEEAGHTHDHGQAFSTWSYESERPFSLAALSEMVKKRLPETVYRCKGVMFVSEEPERRAVLQVVGRRTDVALMDPWNGRTPRTQIVAIGAPGELEEEALRAQFDACLAPG